MDNTLVIEFVGPPGGGKTTNCNSFCAALKRHGIISYVFADIKGFLYKQKLPRKLLFVIRTLLVNGFNLIRFTLLLIRFRMISFNSVFRYFKLCLFNEALKAFIIEKPKCVILLDQWIIQGLWSATIFKSAPSETLATKLKYFYFHVDYILYFDVPIETAVQRIGMRTTNTSRFDTMTEAERLMFMKKFDDYLILLYNHAMAKEKWIVSAMESPEQNEENFLLKLIQLQKIN